ncbi:MAG: PHB depolymerase family esterase [Woeseiaceae bacterium]|nr:PHB depolymerase family esterase [Woeseiaceae bacterium]
MVKYFPMLLVLLAACSKEPIDTVVEAASYNIDSNRISVSGVSSGAYMAGQLHLAHSSIFNGVAIVAGGPYYCAMGELSRGLGPCMKGGELGTDSLIEYARTSAAAGKIDDLANLADDRVWIFHGALDPVVHQSAAEAAAALYTELIADDAVTLVTDVAIVHGFPTLSSGSPCDTFAAPFLNACDYDAAGEILKTVYGELNERVTTSGELLSIPQPGFDGADMLELAYLYVPASCSQGSACGVHVAVHGCSQSSEFVADAFAADAGFNEWADSNNLLVLYPQVESSKVAPMNPYGCWDWWGYTGEGYATKEGPQIQVIKATLDTLAGRTL